MKKGIAFLLCLCMLIGLLPISAFAAKLVDTPNAKMQFNADHVYYCITPEQFTKLGGWSNTSTNLVDSYRQAIMYDGGADTAMEPAEYDLVLPKTGLYNVFVHTRDFSDRPGTRTFSISIGDTEIGTGGNHGQEGWAWQKYENKLLNSGNQVLSFSDSNLWARFDLVLITDDLNFQPENTEEALLQLETDYLYDPSSVTVVKDDPTEGRPDTDIAVKLNGAWMEFDVPPILVNDRTLVPMRAIFEALGCTVSWDDETQTASGVRNGKKVSVTIDSNIATIAGSATTIDQPAILKDDRTLVPLRFISEAYDANVQWDEENQIVTILATIPKTAFYLTGESYATYGTWTMDSSAEGGASVLIGTQPQSSADGQTVTIDDADPSNNQPAAAYIDAPEEGDYRIWVRGRDFATNQQGDRYFNVSVNGVLTEKTYGQHGGEGFKWEDGGIVHLNKGENTIEVLDTSGFFARLAGIFLTEDLEYVPSDDHATLLQIATPVDALAEITASNFPLWAKQDYTPAETASIASDSPSSSPLTSILIAWNTLFAG